MYEYSMHFWDSCIVVVKLSCNWNRISQGFRHISIENKFAIIGLLLNEPEIFKQDFCVGIGGLVINPYPANVENMVSS
jgi:hypothetical protein